MHVINHCPDDNRAKIYGKSAPVNVNLRGKITDQPSFYTGAGGSAGADRDINWKRKVLDNQTGKVYKSINAAADAFGISHSGMAMRCNRGNRFEYVSKLIARQVRDLTTGIIYESANCCAAKVHVTADTVRKHCQRAVQKCRFEYVS